jgi:transcriptional regulator with XRE-family HTH domain
MATEAGMRLQRLRKKRGLLLREAAEQAEISAAYLSQIENGHRAPSANVLMRLAPVLGVSVDALLRSAGLTDAPTPDQAELDHCFDHVMTDPTFEWGNRLGDPDDVEGTPDSIKLMVVRMYEELTGKVLLDRRSRLGDAKHSSTALDESSDAMRTEE